jgi:co-chaperonin GroES (HSP10)
MIVNSNKMKSPDKFIIKMPEKFKSKIAVGDQELELVSKFDEFGNRIMEAEIIAVPAKHKTGAKPGDILYFHHTVALNDTFYLGDNLYLVPHSPGGGRMNLGHAYKNESGVHMIDQWIFLEPMESSKKVRSSVLEIVQEDVPNDRGRVWADSQELSREGLSKGDVVYFSKNSDYEMEVDGTKVWRMLIGDLMYAEV